MRHKHKWVRTGVCYYSCPLQYEEKCECGEVRIKVDKNTGIKKLNEKEFRKKYPQFFEK
jgi:hypothetical protein